MVVFGWLASGGCGASSQPASDEQSLAAVVNGEYLPTCQELLSKATRSVAAVHFELRDDDGGRAVLGGLTAVAARDVTVSVVLEKSVTENGQQIDRLNAAGARATLGSASLYTHAKLLVVDDRVALLGSTNWSAASLGANNEANVRIDDPTLAGWFGRYAAAIFASPDRPPALPPIETALGIPLQDGDYLGRAGRLLDGAARRIRLVMYAMNDDPRYPDGDVAGLIRRLGAARARGVDVRVTLELAEPDLGVNDLNSHAAQVLAAAGVDVRFDPVETVTHAKVLVVDDRVIVASNNWGYGGFHTYHEVGLETAIPAVVDKLADSCDRIHAAGTAAP